MRVAAIAAASVLAVAALSAADFAAASIRQDTNIPAQSLESALERFARERSLQLIYATDEVSSLRSAGASGNLSADEALTRLLKGTGLSYQFLDEKTITVQPIALPSSNPAARSTSKPATSAENYRSLWSRLKLAQARADSSAQTNATSDGADQSAADKREDRSGAQDPMVQEVVVTAQKRAERLKDVPISITVVRGADLDKSTAQGITETLNRVPGVSTTEGHVGGGTLVAVRGVTAGALLSAGSSPIAYYLDSVPFGFITQALAPDANGYDMERVEVLRGPQGTLYGASAQNGVVRVLTKDARLDAFEFKARGLTSSTDGGAENYRGDAAINIPLIAGKLAARAVAGYEDLSGWVDKPNRRDANDAQIRNLRLKINVQPSEALSIGLSSWFYRGDFGAPPMSDDNGQRPTALLDEPVSTDYDVYGLKIGYEFSGASLTSTAGYLDYANDSYLDYFHVAGANTSLHSVWSSRVFSEELALQSKGEGAWRWSVGAMYRDALENDFQFRRQYLNRGESEYNSKSYALFGELTRRFLDGRFELTGGLRYFEDEVDYRQVSLAFGLPGAFLAHLDDRFDALSPRVVLSWHPTGDSTIYTSFSKGFRSGFPQFIAAAPDFPPVKPDDLLNYELGAKGVFWGGRLSVDAAAFFIDWQDVQQSLTVNIAPPGNTPQFFNALINGESASGPGFEAAIAVEPVERLHVGLNFSWNDLSMDGDVVSRGVVLFPKGSRLNLSPEYTLGVAADYSFPLGANGWSAQLTISANRTSEQTIRTIFPLVRSLGVGDPMTLTRASLAISSGRHWTATLFGDNLNNENGASIVQPFGFTDWASRVRPRTIGAQLEYSFR